MKRITDPLFTCFLSSFLIVSCGQLSPDRTIEKTEIIAIDIEYNALPVPGFIMKYEARNDSSLKLNLFVAQIELEDTLAIARGEVRAAKYNITEIRIDTLQGNYIGRVVGNDKTGMVEFRATPAVAIKIAEKASAPIFIDRSLLISRQ